MTIHRQFMLVPLISSHPNPEACAQKILRWLVGLNVVAVRPVASGLRPGHCVYPMKEGALRILDVLDDFPLPIDTPTTGLEFITERGLYTPEPPFARRARCPECRHELGTPLFESLERWIANETDNFECPRCGFEDDVNGFTFAQPCAFSNLGLVFHNWPSQYFLKGFLREFPARFGFPMRIVEIEHVERNNAPCRG